MNKIVAAVVAVTAVALVAAGIASPILRPAPETEADLGSLAWLAGAWAGTDGKMEMEEVWMAPKGGAMLGLHRDVVGDRMTSFEFLRIAVKNDVIAYIASPGGRTPTAFPLKEQSERRVVFENPKHDFPQRIIYWLDEAGSLHARIEGPKEGKEQPMEWTWKPVAASSRPR